MRKWHDGAGGDMNRWSPNGPAESLKHVIVWRDDEETIWVVRLDATKPWLVHSLEDAERARAAGWEVRRATLSSPA